MSQIRTIQKKEHRLTSFWIKLKAIWLTIISRNVIVIAAKVTEGKQSDTHMELGVDMTVAISSKYDNVFNEKLISNAADSLKMKNKSASRNSLEDIINTLKGL